MKKYTLYFVVAAIVCVIKFFVFYVLLSVKPLQNNDILGTKISWFIMFCLMILFAIVDEIGEKIDKK